MYPPFEWVKLTFTSGLAPCRSYQGTQASGISASFQSSFMLPSEEKKNIYSQSSGSQRHFFYSFTLLFICPMLVFLTWQKGGFWSHVQYNEVKSHFYICSMIQLQVTINLLSVWARDLLRNVRIKKIPNCADNGTNKPETRPLAAANECNPSKCLHY